MTKESGIDTGTDRTEKRMKLTETIATVGLLLIAVGIMAPFFKMESEPYTRVFKWVFTAGALTYLGARVADVCLSRDESIRVRRLRRLEAWAGVAFCVGAFFWFYNADRFGETLWTLFLVRETVLFTLVGALIQIIASWMIVSVIKKENKKKNE